MRIPCFNKIAASPVHWVFLFCLLGLPSGFLLAQQGAADEIETLLETSAVTYGQASRFVLEASDAGVFSDTQEAFNYALEQGWLPADVSVDTEARLDGISMLIMRSFGLKGGLFYSISKTPHFSYRELIYKNMIHGRADPSMKTPGGTLLFIVNRVLAFKENEAALIENEAAESERPVSAAVIARREELTNEINEQIKVLAVSDAVARVTDEGITISLSNVQFLADSAELADSEKAKLDDIAQILASIEARTVLIAGHTALAGTEEGRLVISRGRAQSVASYLVSIGAMKEENIAVIGYGATRPLADGTGQDDMAANRRVEITILEQ